MIQFIGEDLVVKEGKGQGPYQLQAIRIGYDNSHLLGRLPYGGGAIGDVAIAVKPVFSFPAPTGKRPVVVLGFHASLSKQDCWCSVIITCPKEYSCPVIRTYSFHASMIHTPRFQRHTRCTFCADRHIRNIVKIQ